MKVVTHPTVTEFWQVAGPLFSADPVHHTVAMTVINSLLAGGRFGELPPVFLTVHDGDDVIGAAFCTPPFPISVTAIPIRAIPAVIDHLLTTDLRPSGISGMQPEAEAFVAAWTERAGAEITNRIDQRLYRLAGLRPPTGVPGAADVATDADIVLVAGWYQEFGRGAHFFRQHPSLDTLLRQVRDQQAAGTGQLIWRVEGLPVSLAVISAPKLGMARIGPVYTPPEHRDHGYASAVTAAAARWGLDQGVEHVLLYTDLSNPVSNSIYQRIGFVPVADALDVTFTKSG